MADVLDYAALIPSAPMPASQYLAGKVPDGRERRDLLAYHGEPQRFGGTTYRLNEERIGGFVGKYWDALGVLGELSEYIGRLKGGRPFDLEFTIDEHPPEVAAFDCLTTAEEVLFVLREIRRRGLPVTHLAPNFGQEKGWDYRCPDGLGGLEQRVRAQFAVAEAFGVLLDFHSADDLTAAPRRVIQRGTGGRHHYKISPMVQLLFAEVLHDYHPKLFRRWWDDAMAYAKTEAAAGSPFAQDCLRKDAASAEKSPSRHHLVFPITALPSWAGGIRRGDSSTATSSTPCRPSSTAPIGTAWRTTSPAWPKNSSDRSRPRVGGVSLSCLHTNVPHYVPH
jgi:hypothetical protein